MRFYIVFMATLFCVTGLIPVSTASSARSSCCDKGIVACPHCAAPCTPVVKKDEETKHCFGVQCKKLCIPRVTFPWQKCRASHACDSCCADGSCGDRCPPPRCGRTKTVKVLMQREYKCPVCKYTFEVKTSCSSGCCAGDVPVPAPHATPKKAPAKDNKTARAVRPPVYVHPSSAISQRHDSK